jgi:hypothetical protein
MDRVEPGDSFNEDRDSKTQEAIAWGNPMAVSLFLIEVTRLNSAATIAGSRMRSMGWIDRITLAIYYSLVRGE